MTSKAGSFTHKLPGEHVYEGVLFFEYSPPEVLDRVKDFNVRDDDVFIVTYPKAGTTWLQEVLWLIMNDGQLKEANEKQVYFRSPFLEFKDTVLNEVGLELAAAVPSPRVIKTHLQKRLAPKQLNDKNCKVVILFRNPKDVCVSYYHFYRSSSSMGNFKGSWNEFFEMFITGHTGHGSWFDFTESWWHSRHNSNVKLIYYEDMKKNLTKSVEELAKFLGRSLSHQNVDDIVKHCSFENMKTNPMTNHEDVYSINKNISPLLRKGTVGDWKNHFTVAQSEVFDKVLEEKLGHLNIPFTYKF
ncbi:sulfotransferase 1C4-like [Octopus sinensis]|uniref:Sulfotransferase 1C4-like n=1 Tax=Octopus sinensis TaxID=2607531 RepID=A0A6P7TEA5_9MOLL|nr:sulfotransferase 1C4-like [Octopus sinensis]